MSAVRTFFYCIGQGIKGLFKNRVYSLASIATISACLILLGAFYFMVRNLDAVLNRADSAVGLTVFFDEGCEENMILDIKSQIEKRVEVSEVKYVSPEEAWEKYKNESLSPELAQVFGTDNPLEDSASLEVYMSDVSLQNSLIRFIKSIDGVRKVNYSSEVSDKLVDIKNIISVISAGLIAVLSAVAIFLIRTTITTGVNVRKPEISIMSVIGATDFFIQAPFVVEGILIGALGSLIPVVVLHYAYDKVTESLATQFGELIGNFRFISGSDLTRKFAPIALLFGAGVGFVTSWATARRQVRKIEVEHL